VQEIKSKGEMLEGTYKKLIVLHHAELSRERLEILRSSPNDLNRRFWGQNIYLWCLVARIPRPDCRGSERRFGEKEYWSMDV